MTQQGYTPTPADQVISRAIASAPELASQPGLATAAGQSGQPEATAETLSGTSTAVATQQAVQHHRSIWGSITHDIGEGLSYLNKPLQEVQHQYRYMRDVYARHGLVAGLTETLAVSGAAGAGFFFGGPEGAILAAEGTTELLGHTTFKDSWDRTSDGEAYRLHGNTISPGRDLARLFGLDTSHGVGKVVSGVSDAAFDLTSDPLIVVGKLNSARKGALGFTDTLAYRSGVATKFVDRFAPGTGIGLLVDGSSRVDHARLAYSGYRQALGEISTAAREQPDHFAGWLQDKFPEIGSAYPLLKDAHTEDAVHDVFRSMAFDGEMAARMSKGLLPSRSLLRVPFSAALEGVRTHLGNVDFADENSLRKAIIAPSPSHLVGAASRKLRTFTGYMPFYIDRATGEISKTHFDPNDPNALQAVYRTLKFSMGAVKAREYTTAFAKGTTSEKKAIWGESQIEMLKALGLPGGPNGHQLIKDVADLTRATSYSDFNELYGSGMHLGDDVSKVTDEFKTQRLALYRFQRGQFAIPDFMVARNALRDMHFLSRQYGKVEDFVYQHIIGGYFKPLALVNTGFGLRVAIAELMPAMFRYGGVELLKARVKASLAKHQYKQLVRGEDEHIIAAAAHAAGGMENLVGLPEGDQASLFRMVVRREGHLVKGVSDAGHNSYILPEDLPGRQKGAMWYLGQKRGTARMQFGSSPDDYTIFRPDDNRVNFAELWHSNLSKRTLEPSAQRIAQDLLEAQKGTLGAGSPVNFDRLVRDSVVPEGGFTVDPISGRSLKAGYSHSVRPDRERAFAKDTFSKDDIKQFVRENVDLLRKRGNHLGGYNDGEGRIVLDVVRVGNDEKSALASAHAAGQKSIYDLQSGREILVNPEAYASRRAAQEGGGGAPGQGAHGGGAGPDSGEDVAAPDRRGAHRLLGSQDPFQFAIRRELNRILGVDERGELLATDPYEYERDDLARYVDQDPTEFATHRVDDVMNLLHSRTGEFHADLAGDMAKGIKPNLAYLKQFERDEMPATLAGQVPTPYIGDSWLNRIVNSGFKRTVDPVINWLSREPIYAKAYLDNLKVLRSSVDHGYMTEAQAERIAEMRATTDILPQIHNTALRSQFAQLARNYMPFYFAQEQAVRRSVYLIAKHPNAFRQYQLVEQSLNEPGFIQTDDNGNRFMILPGVGQFGRGVLAAGAALGLPLQAGLPLSFSGDMASLKTVLPELQPPGVSPLLAIPVNEIVGLFPEYANVGKDIVGPRGFNRSLVDELIPNSFVRNTYHGLRGDDRDAAIANAMFSAMSAAAAHGQIPQAKKVTLPDGTVTWQQPSPAEMQAFTDRLRNNARSIMIMKAVVGFFSPLSPQPSEEDQGLRDEFYKLVDKTGNYSAAVNQFLKEHGSGAVSYTIARSHNPTGADIPVTNQAMSYLTKNRGLIGSHPFAAAYLVPQAGTANGDFQALYFEQIRQGLREKYTPQEFMDQIYIAEGNRKYFAAKTTHDTLVKSGQDDSAAWSDYVQSLARWNPIWWNDFTSSARADRAHRTIADLQYVFANGLAPKGEQTDLVRGLLKDYQTHASILASLGSDPALGHQRQQERDGWSAYLDELSKNDPRLSNVISSVFSLADSNG